LYMRNHISEATESDFIAHSGEIVAEILRNGESSVTMHDGSVLRFTRLPEDYDVKDRERAFAYLKQHPGEVVTGILLADESVPDMHERNQTPHMALVDIPYEKLCPGSEQLQILQEEFI